LLTGVGETWKKVFFREREEGKTGRVGKGERSGRYRKKKNEIRGVVSRGFSKGQEKGEPI